MGGCIVHLVLGSLVEKPWHVVATLLFQGGSNGCFSAYRFCTSGALKSQEVSEQCLSETGCLI